MRRHGKGPRPLSCRAVARLMQPYLDGEVPDARAVLIAQHLEDCRRCGLEAQAYRVLTAWLRSSAAPDDPAQLARLQTFAESLAAS